LNSKVLPNNATLKGTIELRTQPQAAQDRLPRFIPFTLARVGPAYGDARSIRIT
jgi:hypothetical protein